MVIWIRAIRFYAVVGTCGIVGVSRGDTAGNIPGLIATWERRGARYMAVMAALKYLHDSLAAFAAPGATGVVIDFK